MVDFHKPVARLIPGFMALGVLGRAVKLVPKKVLDKKPKVKPKKLVKGFTDIIVGTALIKPVAGIVGKL